MNKRKEAAEIDKHIAARMKPSAAKKEVAAARKYLDDFPPSYDALRDPLSDRMEHAQTVNELLKHLRAVLGD